MTELATAYISIVAETSGIPKQVNSALGQAEKQADKSGKSMGDKLSTGLGKALKGGAATAAAAGVAALGTAMVKGFQRLSAIDDAKGKLEGLGHSTQSTANIMDSALASVKGTAYGLGDAATIAASAVAAGIKPGQELTKYLSLTADAASIAGSSLSEMGSVLNGVQTSSGKAMNDSLKQLSDRGIPIYQWLAEEMKVTGGEVAKMAAKGQVSSEVFFAAIQKNIGGAALASGKTVRGSFENMIAAMGRLGAAAQEGSFSRLPGFFTDVTKRIDDVTPTVKELAAAFDAKVFDEWGPKIRDAFDAFRESGSLDQMRATFVGLATEIQGLGPSVAGIASSLAQASAALGVSGWQLFLTTLQAASTVLNTLNPVLSTTASLMESNQGAVTALVAAWLAFKTVPNIMTKVSDATAPLTSRTKSAASAVTALATAQNATIQAGSMGTVQLGRFGSSIAELGTHTPVIARMQESFVNAAVGATRFGRTAGTAAAASTGLKSAGSALVGVLGGPLNAALMGAGVLFTTIASQTAEARQQQRAYEEAVKASADAQIELNEALLASRGTVNDDVLTAQGQVLAKYRAELEATEDKHMSWWDQVFSFRGSFDEDWKNDINDAATSATEAKRALDDLGISDKTFAEQITGSAGAYEQLRTNLQSLGEDGAQALTWVEQQRADFLAMQDVASRVTPGVSELGDAIRVLGDEGSSSSDKLNALKTAMDAMNPARNEIEAMAQYGEAIAKVAESATGVDQSAFKDDGNLDALSESGRTLSRTLADLADKSAQVASTGGDMATVAAQNEQVFQQLAASTGQPIEKIRELYEQLGGSTVDLAVSLSGAPEVVQDLGKIYAAFEQQPDSKTITIESAEASQQTLNMLDQLNIKWERSPDGKTIEISANDNASAKIAMITQNVNVLNALKATPTLDLSKAQFEAKDVEARTALQSLDRTAVSPEAGLVIDKLLEGKNVSMAQLEALSATTANPQVNLEIQKIMEKIGIVNTGLDNAAKTRTASIDVIIRAVQSQVSQNQTGIPYRQEYIDQARNNAEGSIRAYAAGGIRQLERFANGGGRELTDPAILPGTGSGTLFVTPAGPAVGAEGETNGEAWIPFALSKRSRSTDILATVAKMFGYALIPEGNLPTGISELLGAVGGGALSRLLKLTGIDQLASFADGGITGADALRKLAEGTGASQPLTGAPYVWGGTNWGDCSGTMSAFARYAAGLDPFGGRFSTATMGSQIQQMGGSLGRGSSGDLRFGWYNGGAGGGHTAGTLPDGTNIEMGGSYGGGMLGGSVGADSSQFTEHAYFPIGSSWSDPGSDSGGWVQRPDGTWVRSSESGDYSSSSGAGDTSISGRAGSVASSFVSGHVADIFDVLGVNDSPGWLAALVEYENSHRSSSSSSVSAADKEAAKTEYDTSKQQLKATYDSEKLARQQEYELKRQQIKDDQTAGTIDKAEADRRLNELKHQHETDEQAKKQAYEAEVAQAQAKYDAAVGKSSSTSSSSSSSSASALQLKQSYEDDKLARSQQHDTEKAARKATYDAELDALKLQKKNKEITKEAYDAQAAELKTAYEHDLAEMKISYDNAELEKKQAYDSAAAALKTSSTSGTSSGSVTDPGTSLPGQGEDLGSSSSTGNTIKDAFRLGLREAWRSGQPWDDTDWIIGKESNWNPTAVNPSSGAFGLPQFLGTTKDQYLPDSSTDPTVQGKAYDKYVDDRYTDPMGARAHWEANGWYDSGGVASGRGAMLKDVIEPERVLSPSQTAAFEEGMRGGFGTSTAVEAKFDQLIAAVLAMDGGTVNATFRDEREFYDRQARLQRARIAAASGARG